MYDPELQIGDTLATYEIWEEARGRDGKWKPASRRWHEIGYDTASTPQKTAEYYNEDQKYHDRYMPKDRVPSRRFFVVKATTEFERLY